MELTLGNKTLFSLAFLLSVLLSTCVGQGYEPPCPVTEGPDKSMGICYCLPQRSGEVIKWEIDCNFKGYGPNMPAFLRTDDVIDSLDFRYNYISHIQSYAFRNIPGLRELNLAQQHYYGNASTLTAASGAFRGLNNLESLALMKNDIENITQVINPSTVDGLNNLTELYLFNNKIERVEALAFNGLSNLEVLNLNFNRITRIEVNAFVGLQRLQKLFLSGNRITRVDPGVFSSLTMLDQLFLNDNKIEEVSPKAFDRLKRLSDLRLNKNQLKKLDDMVIFGLDKREIFLHVGRNPLHCDCDLNWLRSLENPPAGSCLTPQELRGERVVSFPIKDCERATEELMCKGDDCTINSGTRDGVFRYAVYTLAVVIAALF